MLSGKRKVVIVSLCLTEGGKFFAVALLFHFAQVDFSTFLLYGDFCVRNIAVYEFGAVYFDTLFKVIE